MLLVGCDVGGQLLLRVLPLIALFDGAFGEQPTYQDEVATACGYGTAVLGFGWATFATWWTMEDHSSPRSCCDLVINAFMFWPHLFFFATPYFVHKGRRRRAGDPDYQDTQRALCSRRGLRLTFFHVIISTCPLFGSFIGGRNEGLCFGSFSIGLSLVVLSRGMLFLILTKHPEWFHMDATPRLVSPEEHDESFFQMKALSQAVSMSMPTGLISKMSSANLAAAASSLRESLSRSRALSKGPTSSIGSELSIQEEEATRDPGGAEEAAEAAEVADGGGSRGRGGFSRRVIEAAEARARAEAADRTAARVAKLTVLGASRSNIDAMGGSRPNLDAMGGSRPNLNALGGSRPNLNALGGSRPNLNALGGSRPNLNALGGSRPNLNAFGAPPVRCGSRLNLSALISVPKTRESSPRGTDVSCVSGELHVGYPRRTDMSGDL